MTDRLTDEEMAELETVFSETSIRYLEIPRQELFDWLKAEREHSRKALDIVNQQAEDDGLWFNAESAPEAYLQQELRKLHKAIEG